MDFSMLSSVLSAVLFAVFVGIVAWVYAARNRGRFEEAAMLPFDDEDWVSSGRRQVSRRVGK
ncbi:MAG: CcoQ/FixQ family Cbb3-type cytochrome c oxidase assembly chaperone [Burkholderiales bacterium]|nr:CcoQ/FixQ family Cbb3-type cytochrome c oxidase assembly chaperone [Burkholderiales bacterium]